MEGEYTGGLWAEIRCSIRKRDVAMKMFVMRIICSGDPGQKPGDHLDDLRDRHGANLVLSVL